MDTSKVVDILAITCSIGSVLCSIAVYYLHEKSNRGENYLLKAAKGEDKEKNLSLAMQELERLTSEYKTKGYKDAFAQKAKSLALCYGLIADLRDKDAYLQKAINVLEEARTAVNKKKFSKLYMEILGSLASYYEYLGSVKDKATNQSKAITLREEELSLIDRIKSPRDYAKHMRSLAVIYQDLGTIQKNEKDLQRALRFFEDALKTMDSIEGRSAHKEFINNLGVCHVSIAKLNKSIPHNEEGIKLLSESKSYCNKDSDPLAYVINSALVAEAYVLLAETKDKEKNLKIAMGFWAELRSFTLIAEKVPPMYGLVLLSMANTLCKLSEIENRDDNLKNAMLLYNNILNLKGAQSNPTFVKRVQTEIEKTQRMINGESLEEVGLNDITEVRLDTTIH